MSIIYHGQGLVELPASYTSKEDRSGTTTRTFQGVDSASLYATASILLGDGYSVAIEEGPPIWTLTANAAYNVNEVEDPIAQWSVQTQQGQQNILESNVSLVATLSSDTKERILQAVKNPNKSIPLVSTSNTSQLTNATKIKNEMLAGADSHPVFSKTYTRTITVPNWWVSDWDFSNEGKVLSLSTLISNTDMPYHVQLLTKSSGDLTLGTDGIQLYRGYLELGVQMQDAPKNQVQISQTWVLNDWIKHRFTII